MGRCDRFYSGSGRKGRRDPFAGIDWTEAAADWLDKGYLDDIEAGQFPDLMFNVINACNVARGAYEGTGSWRTLCFH